MKNLMFKTNSLTLINRVEIFICTITRNIKKRKLKNLMFKTISLTPINRVEISNRTITRNIKKNEN